MRLRRLLTLLVVLALAAGTGGSVSAGGPGTATIWVTRDRGATALVTPATVPAGERAIDALRRVAKVGTSYGGRYVESVNGISGSLSERRDWFFFVNGIQADVGAAEYRLHPGDVEWWDFRSWQGAAEAPVVVGAFPEPFLHGYDGKVRVAAVRYRGAAQKAGALALGRLVRAASVLPEGQPVPSGANLLLVLPGRSRFVARLRDPSGGAGSPVEFDLSGDALALARRPASVRYRYEVAG